MCRAIAFTHWNNETGYNDFIENGKVLAGSVADIDKESGGLGRYWTWYSLDNKEAQRSWYSVQTLP